MRIKFSQPFIRRTLSAAAGLSLAFGAVAATAPAANASNPFPCNWTSLTLINGWQSANADWGTGDPRYCVASLGGISYQAGS